MSSTVAVTPVAWVHLSRARPSWYLQSGLEQKQWRERWAAVAGGSTESGAVFQGTFDVRAQSDYSVMQLWSFPDVAAAFAHWTALVDAGYAQWFAFSNTVGTAKGDAV